MSEVIHIDPHTDQRYNAFLEGHPGATIFHAPQWMRAMETTYGFRQASLACVDGDRVTGVLPLLEIRSILTGNRAVSLPFSDYCAPLTETPEITGVLLAHCDELRKRDGWKFVELRWAIDGTEHSGEGEQYKRHRLSLDRDAKKVFSTFDKTRTASRIRKFQRAGGIVERRSDWAAMETFMQLNYQTRRKHGIPPQPDAYFRNLWKLVIQPGNGFVCIARLGEKPLAASMFLPFKDTVYYKYSASDRETLHLAPNYGVLWDAISWACENGYRVLDMGRTDLVDAGLLEFKRRWGTEETDISYTRLGTGPGKTEDSPLDKLRPMLRHTPVPVLKFLGRVLYAHVG